MLALELLEQSYLLKEKNLPPDSVLLETAHRELVLTINSCAMKALSEDKFDVCLDLLRKSEHYTTSKQHASLRVLTFNNLGCYYRRLGKLKAAYTQLKAAVQLGAEAKSGEHLAVTHLNMCAILSQKGQHEKALENAQVAVYHAQEELVSAKLKKQESTAAGTPEEQMLTLAMAYHNMAVELEFVGKYQLCLQWYKKAMQLVGEHKDTQQAMYANFRKSYLEVRKKVQGGTFVEKEGGESKKKTTKHKSHFLASQLNHFSRRDEYEAELFKKLHSSSGQSHKPYSTDTDTRPTWNTDVRTITDPDDPRYFSGDEEEAGEDGQMVPRVQRVQRVGSPKRAGVRRRPPKHGGLETQSEHIYSSQQRGASEQKAVRRQRPTSAHANLTQSALRKDEGREDRRRQDRQQERQQERQHQPRQTQERQDRQDRHEAGGARSRRPVSARERIDTAGAGQRRQRPESARPASARGAAGRESKPAGARRGRPTSAQVRRADEQVLRKQRPTSAAAATSSRHKGAKGNGAVAGGGSGGGRGGGGRRTGRGVEEGEEEYVYEEEEEQQYLRSPQRAPQNLASNRYGEEEGRGEYGGEYKENNREGRAERGHDQQKYYGEEKQAKQAKQGKQDYDEGDESAADAESKKLRYLEQLERANREAQEALEYLMRAGAAPEAA
jgi:tetratricopeptide (TPR) repeat protein